MNAEYISRALCFHGQPLQKIWADERGADDLQNAGVADPGTYPIYLERQKYFTFQDRAKRLKLHQFFSRKAMDLYDRTLRGPSISSELERVQLMATARPYIAALPPYEFFTGKNQEKFKRLRCLLEGLSPGDVVYGVVTKTALIYTTMLIKPLCTAEPKVRYLGDVTRKATVPPAFIKPAIDKKGNTRPYNVNDVVCCEIMDVSVDADRINLTMEPSLTKNKNIKFGLVSAEDLPNYYRVTTNCALDNYNDCLLKAKEFLNPNYDILFELNGLDVNDNFTLMQSLKTPFPRADYAQDLRQAQASKWAFRSVAEGIEHFKIGRHIEAFQCLNKALSIDPRNVEGLVARGALYANKGSFLKAVDDFEKALALNSYHVNARKYMGETLVALGRSYEEDNRIEDALKAYKDCLNIIPNHEQARLSIESLQQRPGIQQFDDFLSIPGTGQIDLNIPAKAKQFTSHSSASSSSGSGSSGTESDSDSNGIEKLHSQQKKDLSLSPLSKRIAAQGTASTTVTSLHSTKNQFSQPFYMANQSNMDIPSTSNIKNPNDFRLDDDDTETRVRKLLQDASKYKKEKKKSKKKKSKKSKKETRKEKSVATTFLQNLEKIDFTDAFQAITGLQTQNKLNENLNLYEKTIAQIKKRQELLEQSTSMTNRIINSRTHNSPPPAAPSMSFDEDQVPPPPPSIKASFNKTNTLFASTSRAKPKEETPRFSFTIKRPVKVDKFGLVRIATPLDGELIKSPTKSHSRSRSRSRNDSKRRSRSDSSYSRSHDGHRSKYRSRSRSNSFDRYKRRRSRSRSYDRHRRSGSRSRFGRGGRGKLARRRTPSPFVPRGTPSPRRRERERSRHNRHSERTPPRRSGKGRGSAAFGNRVWKRPGYTPGDAKSERWLHDKFDEKSTEDGPSIEEIDEIINKAQKERKEEIIKRDKNILKKK